jgi:type I restriction enzyme, S subunit
VSGNSGLGFNGSWPVVQLRHLFAVVSGGTPDTSEPEFWDGNILWITPEDVGSLENPYLQDTRRKLTAKGYENCGAKLVPAGSLVLTKRAPIGQLAILNSGACSNQGCFLLAAKQKLDSRFFYYLLFTHADWLQALGRGSTLMELSTDDMKAFRAPLPPLAEQQAIADMLDREAARLDTLLAEKERLLALLAEKRRALITRAVTQGLDSHVPMRGSGLPWLGKIPAHWPIERAKYLFKQSALPVMEDDDMVTCFRDGQVTLRKNRREEGFTNANLELGYQGIRAGQLVLHSMDAFAGAIGVSDSDGKCSPEYIICDPIDRRVNNYYFGHLLRTMALNGFIQASCPAVRERAPRIRFNDFGEMFFPVPPPDEQRIIVAHIETETRKLGALRTAAERTIVLLKERRAALIAAAVTGQIPVGAET